MQALLNFKRVVLLTRINGKSICLYLENDKKCINNCLSNDIDEIFNVFKHFKFAFLSVFLFFCIRF